MKSKKLCIKHIITLFILSLTICKADNDKEESNDKGLLIQDSNIKDEIKVKNNYNNSKIYLESRKINISEVNIENVEILSIDFEGPLNLTDEEMDMILLCVYISQQALKTKLKEEIKIIAENIGISDTKKVYDKLGLEFSEKCIDYIETETVSKYISNLTYHNNFVWEKEFDNFTTIDFDKYKTVSDLKFTVEQQVLLNLLHQSNKEFQKRKREKKNNNNNNIKIIYSDININDKKEKQKESENIKNENNSYNSNKNNSDNITNNKKSIFLEHIMKKMKFLPYFVLALIIFGAIMYFCWKKEIPIKDKNKNTKIKKEKNE